MDINGKVTSIISAYTEPGTKITMNTDLVNEANIDSFRALLIINDIEKSFRIQVEIDEIFNTSSITVRDVITFLSNKMLKESARKMFREQLNT